MQDFEKVIPERYRASYDKIKDCFYILDTWHPQIKNLPNLEDSIPDDSPALKTVTGTEINAIIEEMKKIGYLDQIIKVNAPRSIIENKESSNEDLVKAIKELTSVIYNSSPRKAYMPLVTVDKKKVKNNRNKTVVLNG
jgi:hypothetical protein